MNPISETKNHPRGDHRLATGIVLISIGIAILLTRWLNLDAYLVLVIGASLLGWGSLSHRAGLIISGGVLTGVGLGILVYEGPWSIPETNQNGLFLVCFALGWFLITLLTGLFTGRIQWWPVIPGGIMAILGAAVLWRDDPRVWHDYFGWMIPILLVLLGVYLILRRGRPKPRD
jgi:hypothetical protein